MDRVSYLDLKDRFKSYLFSLPKLYGLPKIHKNNAPMRPIISTINSVWYKLAGWLFKILTSTLNWITGIHLTNNNEFVNKIRHKNLRDKRMISFDVISLFTNMPELDVDLPVSIVELT